MSISAAFDQYKHIGYLLCKPLPRKPGVRFARLNFTTLAPKLLKLGPSDGVTRILQSYVWSIVSMLVVANGRLQDDKEFLSRLCGLSG
jgi:hypothetical protein